MAKLFPSSLLTVVVVIMIISPFTTLSTSRKLSAPSPQPNNIITTSLNEDPTQLLDIAPSYESAAPSYVISTTSDDDCESSGCYVSVNPDDDHQLFTIRIVIYATLIFMAALSLVLVILIIWYHHKHVSTTTTQRDPTSEVDIYALA